MPPSETPQRGTKRTRSGRQIQKSASALPSRSQHSLPTEQTRPICAQPPREPHTSSAPATLTKSQSPLKQQTRQTQLTQNPTKPTRNSSGPAAPHRRPNHPHNTNTKLHAHDKKTKMPRLPDNATLTKRPIAHPAAPLPFTNAASPKIVYLKTASPFIPTIKRIRLLLREISKRASQSESASFANLRTDGRLSHAAVERAMAEDANAHAANRGGKGGKGAECVYVKATGRAIERALEIGGHFLGERDCRARVEMGSVRVVDDVEVVAGKEDTGAGETGADVEMRDADDPAHGKGKRKKTAMADEDIPETRIRYLSTVTVAISLI